MPLNRKLAALAAVVAVSSGVWLSAQTPQVFQFYVSATDAAGVPVTDLRPEDVVMTENGVKQKVVKVEPLSIPMKLTIAVDNGRASGDAIEYYRAGLKGLVDALPPALEVTLLATAPQPRTVVKPTTDHEQLLRGIDAIAPDTGAPRFTDTLIEFTQRLQREAKDSKAAPYLPVLVMLSTGVKDATTYQQKQVEQAIGFLAARHARFNAILISTRAGDVAAAAALDGSLQGIVSVPAAKATNGHYEKVTVPTLLPALMVAWGKELAELHTRQSTQFRVTVERTKAGDLQSPRIELARPGLSGSVTIDGYLP